MLCVGSCWCGLLLLGKVDTARELIAQGCVLCKNNEDVWLEAARLEKPSGAKSILANGVHENPTSVSLLFTSSIVKNSGIVERIIAQRSSEGTKAIHVFRSLLC